jgi:hypothetical protein
LLVVPVAACFPGVRALPPPGAGGTTGAAGAAGGGDGAAGSGPHTTLIVPDGSSMGAGGDIGDVGGQCEAVTYDVRQVTSDLLVLLDRSSAVSSNWDGMVSALDQVVAGSDSKIDWGLKYLADNDQCLVASGLAVAVAVGPGQASAIATSISNTAPGGLAIPSLAVRQAASYLTSLADNNPKYILFVTGGGTSCPLSDGITSPVQDAFNLGVSTFVVAVGSGGAVQGSLNDTATAGGVANAPDAIGRLYYAADDSTGLLSAFGAIAKRVSTCTLGLAMVPPVPNNIAVIANGAAIPKDPTNGWSYGAGMQSIRISGSYCDMLESGAIQSVVTVFGCPYTPLPVP